MFYLLSAFMFQEAVKITEKFQCLVSNAESEQEGLISEEMSDPLSLCEGFQ